MNITSPFFVVPVIIVVFVVAILYATSSKEDGPLDPLIHDYPIRSEPFLPWRITGHGGRLPCYRNMTLNEDDGEGCRLARRHWRCSP